MAESIRSRRRRTRRRRAVAVGVGVLVVAGGGAVAIATTGDDGPSLRLATVRRGSVTQAVESSGTVTSSLKVTPAFAATGTVASVAVKVGDEVGKGQVLARLQTAALQAAVDSAQATLAGAKQRLEGDRTGQLGTASNGAAANSGSSDGASSNRGGTGNLTTSSLDAVELSAAVRPTASAASTAPSGPSGPSTGSVGRLSAQVKQAQTAVLAAQHAVDEHQVQVDAAQHTVDTAVTQNTTLRDAQRAACAADQSGSTDSCASAMAAYEASADVVSRDLATLDAAITAQDSALKKLDVAITALDRLVTQLRAAAAAASRSTGSGASRAPSAPSTGKAPTTGSGRPTTGTGPDSSGNSSSGNSTPTPASASQLAADQAAIDAAAAQLATARQSLAAATLTSPVAGRVAGVGLTAGSSSSGQTITIIGTHGQGVETSVPLAQIDTVKVGQHVTVAADGVTATLRGTVTSVGLLSTSSGSTTTFPVTVTLVPSSRHLYDGIGAEVVIATGSAANVITVPNSAIHSGARGTHTVSVRSGGKTSTRPVTLGLVGTDVSQISSGLSVGAQVVLAELSQPLPSSSTNKQGSPFGRGGTAVFVPRFGTGRAGGR